MGLKLPNCRFSRHLYRKIRGAKYILSDAKCEYFYIHIVKLGLVIYTRNSRKYGKVISKQTHFNEILTKF